MKRIVLLAAGLVAVAMMPSRADAGRRVCRQKQVVVANQQQFAVTQYVTPIAVPVAPVALATYQSGAQYAQVGYQQPVARQQYRQPAVQQQQLQQYQLPPLQSQPAPACQSCQCQQNRPMPRQQQLSPAQQKLAYLRAQIAELEAESGAAGGYQQQQGQPPQGQREFEQQQPSLIVQHCAKCHNGTPADPRIISDFRDPATLNCDQRIAAINRVLADDAVDRMPRGQTLDSQTIGLLIQELARQVGPSQGPSQGPQEIVPEQIPPPVNP